MFNNTEAFNALKIKMNTIIAQITTNLMTVNSCLEKLLASRAKSIEDMRIAEGD